MFKRYKQKIYQLFGLAEKIDYNTKILGQILEKQAREFAEADYFRRFTLTTIGRLTKPIFPGQWAGDFAFFYSLSRLLFEYKFENILELGARQSTIFINDVLSNETYSHYVIEHDVFFVEKTQAKLKVKDSVKFINAELVKRQVSYSTTNYMYDLKNLEGIKDKNIDLLIVDGPFGSDSLSRFEIVEIFDKGYLAEDFIIVFDDTHRLGEQETLNLLIERLKTNRINHFIAHYEGAKRVTYIGTDKYNMARSF